MPVGDVMTYIIKPINSHVLAMVLTYEYNVLKAKNKTIQLCILQSKKNKSNYTQDTYIILYFPYLKSFGLYPLFLP